MTNMLIVYSLSTEASKAKGGTMKKRRVSELTVKDIGRKFRAGKREIVIIYTFQSLYLGEDINTNEEFTFYNTGESTSIHCPWLERGSR